MLAQKNEEISIALFFDPQRVVGALSPCPCPPLWTSLCQSLLWPNFWVALGVGGQNPCLKSSRL